MSSGHGLSLDDAAWSSPWRARAVRDKAVLSLGLVVSALVLPTWPGTMLVGGAAAILLLGPAGLPGRLLGKVLRWPAAFLACGAASVLVSVGWDGHPVVAVTRDTAAAALALLAHGVSGLLAVLVLAATTPMVDLLESMRRARVPAACVDIAQLTYRLLFVLLSTTQQIRASQEARLGYANRRTALGSAAALVAAVFVRSWDRAQRLEAGLAGRGYVDDLTTLAPHRHASTRFLTAGLALVATIGVATLSLRQVWTP